jgi:hypothetical protein
VLDCAFEGSSAASLCSAAITRNLLSRLDHGAEKGPRNEFLLDSD